MFLNASSDNVIFERCYTDMHGEKIIVYVCYKTLWMTSCIQCFFVVLALCRGVHNLTLL